MKVAMVYFREEKDLNTEEVLSMMKLDLKKENWKYLGLFMDKMNEYDSLFYLITEELANIDVLYIYNNNNIPDEFYWELLIESAKSENVLVKEFKPN